jgi:hypothetical protein
MIWRRSVLVILDQRAISGTERPHPRQRPDGRSMSQTLTQGVSIEVRMSMLLTLPI